MTKDKEQFDSEELEARRVQAIRLINVGGYLQNLRKTRNLTLAEVGDKVSISPTYLSDIEHGRKLPSEIAIRDLANFYEIDELDLFTKFGKIPISVKEELHDNVWLQRTLQRIRKNKKMTEDKKQDFYDRVQLLYRDMFDNDE